MEDKQLDFNAPLLSVRRFSSTAVSSEGQNRKKNDNSIANKNYVPPFYKSDLKSGPLRNAGAVPFMWEQIPGRRKDGEGSKDRSIERPPVAPKLPPGRTSDVKPQSSDIEFEDKTIVRPQSDNGVPNREMVLPPKGNAAKLESSKESKKEKRDSDSEDCDEVYADALDTLSRTESFFFNCSVSGISGLDETKVTRTGPSSTDCQNRDFMMDRFLPAAKAMASETTLHASWKQPVAREQPVMAKKVVNGDKRPPLYQYKPYIVPQYVEEPVEDSEDEDDDYDYGSTGNLSPRACGFLPKFCLKNSFCLLNPVPGIKVRSRDTIPSIRKSNAQVKTSYSESYNKNDDLNNWEAVYKHKLMSGLQPLDDESKLTSESNQLTYWSDSQTPDGSSPHMKSVGGGISPFRSEAIQSPFHEGTGFLGTPKQNKNIKVNNSISYKDSKWRPDSLSPMVEKTLYVDSEHLRTLNSYLSSPDANRMIGWKEKNSENVSENSEIDDSPGALSYVADINNLTISQENSERKISEVVGSGLRLYTDRSNSATHINSKDGFDKGDRLDQESRPLNFPKVGTSRNPAFDRTSFLKEVNQEHSDTCQLQLPLPPPLPKSPSESWLWRTLPSVSSKNGASFHPRKLVPKTPPPVDPKWETIVKTTKPHHGHLRFSQEELSAPLPQQSETLKFQGLLVLP